MKFQKAWKSVGILIPLLGIILTGLLTQKTIQTDDGVLLPASSSISLPLIGSKVMLQAFYWDTPQYTWYNTLNTSLKEIYDTGFDAIWLPPPSKAQSGGFSMGYDPYDYYDLGEYNQKGTIATRFGVKSQLLTLLNHSRSLNLSVIGDIVLNHNSGGSEQFNPNTNSNTYTDFSLVASNNFLRGYNDFHPSSYEASDEGIFGGFPDLCHANPYVNDSLLTWGEWLRDKIGFDGWRFDYVKGYHASMVEDWIDTVGGWGVVEFWDGNKDLIFDYLDSTGNKVSAFDFPLYYTLRDLCNSDGSYDMRNLANLNHLGVVGSRPLQSVTFVANHDTDEIVSNKMMAYALILTSEGYPSVFWSDWQNPSLKAPINNLIDIHNRLARGTTTVLYSDENFYVAQRNGDPGCIIAINDGNEWRGEFLQSKWMDEILIDHTHQALNEITDSDGWTEIWAPPKGYTVFAPNGSSNPSQETTTLVSTTTDSSSSINPASSTSESPTSEQTTAIDNSSEGKASAIAPIQVIFMIAFFILVRRIYSKQH